VTDATILIPTHRHALLLPLALRSALAQRDAAVEVFVVGDGVEDDTRAALEPFLADRRVRFFDRPKGERYGERHRHEALQEADGALVCYLSDDDLLLPGHVAEMRRLLEHADFAHSAPVRIHPDGTIEYRPVDLHRPEFLTLALAGRVNPTGLTGASHSRSLYERLPQGWRPAPEGVPTDIYMWRQIFAMPGFRGSSGTRVTALNFPDPAWRGVEPGVRAAELESWLARIAGPGGEEELDELLRDATRRAAQDFKLRTVELRGALREATAELERLRTPGALRVLRRIARLRRARPL